MTSEQTAVMATEAQWVKAHCPVDMATIGTILDEDYKRIEGDRVLSKADIVASYGAGKRHWDVAEGSDYSVNVFEGFALVVGTWYGRGINNGVTFDYRARFLAVYIKRLAGWKLYRDEVFEASL